MGVELPVASQVTVRLGWERSQPEASVMIPELAHQALSRLIHSVPVSEVNYPYLQDRKLPKVMLLINRGCRVDPEWLGSETSLLFSPAMLLQFHG